MYSTRRVGEKCSIVRSTVNYNAVLWVLRGKGNNHFVVTSTCVRFTSYGTCKCCCVKRVNKKKINPTLGVGAPNAREF